MLEEEPVPVHGAGGNVPDKHVSQSGEWTRVSCQGTSLYSQWNQVGRTVIKKNFGNICQFDV